MSGIQLSQRCVDLEFEFFSTFHKLYPDYIFCSRDIQEIKAFQSPPALVKKVVEVVGVILGETDLSWKHLKAMVSASDFIKRIDDYKMGELSEGQLTVLKEIFDQEHYNLQRAGKVRRQRVQVEELFESLYISYFKN